MIKKNIPFEQYILEPGINISKLSTISVCPALFKYVLEAEQQSTAAQDLGQQLHTLVLETDKYNDRYFCLPDIDRRTTKGKELYAELVALHKDKIPVKPDDFEIAHRMAGSIRENTHANYLLEGAHTELTLDWVDEATGVQCKARVDAYNEELGIVIDLKTTVDASPKGFPKKLLQYGYHRQAAWYLEALKQNGEAARHFVFLAIEKAPPYLVGVYRISDDTIRLSKAENEKLLRIYAECKRTDTWPGYTQGIEDISIPDYAINNMEETYGEPI